MSSSLDVGHARMSAGAARRCRELAGALLVGEDRWLEVRDLVGVLEGHIRSSSPVRSAIHWRVVVALAHALDCDRHLRDAARSRSSGVAEERARLPMLLLDLDEVL